MVAVLLTINSRKNQLVMPPVIYARGFNAGLDTHVIRHAQMHAEEAIREILSGKATFGDIKSAIKNAKIPVRTSTLACKVFLLSGNEVGLAGTPYLMAEGVKLDYFNANRGNDAKRIAYLSGKAVEWWTRTQETTGTYCVFYINASGSYNTQYPPYLYGVRPALVLPYDTKFDSDTNQFKGVA